MKGGVQSGEEWREYYAAFPYFAHELVRPGCHPWKMINPSSSRSVVLVHGLSDSPFFMMALANHFHQQLGYSVFVPLLQGHGLYNPANMRNVSYSEWQKNVLYAARSAEKHGTVSIGGLSTGATLAIAHMHARMQQEGDLLLFSAALALAGGAIGRLKERLLRKDMADVLPWLQRNRDPIGRHPYRYSFVHLAGAIELIRLMHKVSDQVKQKGANTRYFRRMLAVHHENDNVVSYSAAKSFAQTYSPACVTFMNIPGTTAIGHAGVVLEKDILGADGQVLLERANPHFDRILREIDIMCMSD